MKIVFKIKNTKTTNHSYLMKNKNLLLVSFLLVFILPFLGSYFKFGGFPPGYGLFPAQKVVDPPGFDLTYFIVASSIAVLILVFLFFPTLFGFKKISSQSNNTEVKEVSYPIWFYYGLVLALISWFFMWLPFPAIYVITNFTFVPLWWGFILFLDGIVFKRMGGYSLIANKPNTMKIMAVTSSFSWFVFEFLNFFVLEDWYYPNYQILTNFGNISWQLISYTTVLPAIFEWYLLLRTFKKLEAKYSFGPVIPVSKTLQIIGLVLGCILLFFMGVFPYPLFWMLWISLIPILVPAMTLYNFWTPFTPIMQRGNWSFVILIGLATVLNGFFWEFWNYGSEFFHHDFPTNPNYWKYSVPYVGKFYLFSEMPILGYFGYLFFGNVCWVLWVVVAHLVGFDPHVDLKQDKSNEI
jgi:hypothetical protein